MSTEKESKKKTSTPEAETHLPALPDEHLPAALDPLRAYFNEISQYPVMTREQEARVAKHYDKHHDRPSAERLVVSNLRLVVKIALEYKRAYQNLLDLIQEGNIGLLRAVQKYDITKGTRFSYYASWWIRAYILKYIIDNFRLVKLGTTQAQKKLFYNLMREKQKMEAMGFVPKTKLLSERLDVKEKEVVEMEQRMGRADMSLDAPRRTMEGKYNIDFFAADVAPADYKVEQNDLKQQLFENLDEFMTILKNKEITIFEKRLFSEVPQTLQEIADEYGITRERIRQIEERVIRKLKTFFKEKGFDIDVDETKKKKTKKKK